MSPVVQVGGPDTGEYECFETRRTAVENVSEKTARTLARLAAIVSVSSAVRLTVASCECATCKANASLCNNKGACLRRVCKYAQHRIEFTLLSRFLISCDVFYRLWFQACSLPWKRDPLMLHNTATTPKSAQSAIAAIK